jgi:hypothetical protein
VDLKKLFTHPKEEKDISPLQFVIAILKNILRTTSIFGNCDSIFKDSKLAQKSGGFNTQLLDLEKFSS